MRPADRTPDDGRGSGGHRGTGPFFLSLLRNSEPEERTSRTTSAMRWRVNSCRHAGRAVLFARFAAEFPASARNAERFFDDEPKIFARSLTTESRRAQEMS